MTARRTRAALACALLAAAASADDGLRPGETVRESDAAYPDTDDALWVVRIVDAVTKKPIEGATVRVPNHEPDGATPEDIYDLFVAKTDAGGWARVPLEKSRLWSDYVFADAPGHAADEYCTPGKEVCELQRGADVSVVLLDFMGRPVPGARVAVNNGCGHVAPQREATTDAQGRAVFRSIDAARRNDVYVESPTVETGIYGFARAWRPGDPPVPVHARPGIVVEGRVLAADGKPLQGARVGPWKGGCTWRHTDADGRFRLVGVERRHDIQVMASDESDEEDASFIAPPEGVFRTVTLGAAAEATSKVAVTVRAGEELATGVRVAFVRRSDGFVASRITWEEGATKLEVPSGTYDVFVDGLLGAYGDAKTTVEMKDGAPAAVELQVPKNPTIALDTTRLAGFEGKVFLATARRLREFKGSDIDVPRIAVPAEERAVFRVSHQEDGETIVRFIEVPPPGPERERPLVLDWAPTTFLTAHLMDADGKPTPGRLYVRRNPGEPYATGAAPASAAPSATTRLTGAVAWTVVADGLGAHGTLVLPDGIDEIDLGPIRLVPPPPAPPKLKSSLRLVVRDEAGAPLHFARVFSDERHGATDEDGVFVLDGLPAGAREVVVADDGRLAKVFGLRVADGEARGLTVVLRAKP